MMRPERAASMLLLWLWCSAQTSGGTLTLGAPPVNGGTRASSLALIGDGQAGSGGATVLAFGVGSAADAALGLAAEGLEVLREGAGQVALSAESARLPVTALTGELAVAASPSVGGVRQWALWELETFDTEADSGQWSLNDHGFCGAPTDQFLGGHCRFAAATTTRRYSDLPAHSKVRVRARIHFIDDWQGDSVMMQVNGQTVWAQAHEWCPSFLKWMCTKYGVDTCGRGTPDRLSVGAEATLEHSSGTLEVAFASTLPHGTDACQTSWGVDDIAVELI
mmetsp:Transcript_125700/g.268209  ORF Transcript_125700/g.268209 Transcript_125700/m.268209 type:complete len:279 (-) Transcript_125700:46-882(-)